MDIQSLCTTRCRLCLAEYGHLNKLFESGSNTDNNRAIKVSMCTYTKIEIGDGLPSVICDSCLSFVEHWDTFRLKCEAATAYFHQKQMSVNYGNLTYIHAMDDTVSQDADSVDGETTTSLSYEMVTPTEVIDHISSRNESNTNGDDITCKRRNFWRKHLEDVFKFRIYRKGNNGQRMPNLRNHETVCYKICSECQMSFSSEDDLKAHEVTHLNSLFNWRQHTSLHDEAEVGKLCDANWSTETESTTHVSVDTVVEPFKDSPVGEQDIVINMDVDNNLSCEKSPRNDQNNTEVGNSHLIENVPNGHQSDNENADESLKSMEIFCEICNKKFSNTQDHHVYIVENPDKINYSNKCVVCWMPFNSKEELKAHKSNHNDERFPCKHCHEIYFKKSDWKKHRKIHNNKKDRKRKDKSKTDMSKPVAPDIEIIYDKKKDFDYSSIPVVDIESSGSEDSSGNIEKLNENEHSESEHVQVTNNTQKKIKGRTNFVKTSEIACSSNQGLDYQPNSSLDYWCRCSICGIDLKMKFVKKHLKLHAKIYGNYCILCSKHFLDVSNLTCHLGGHFNVKPHFCFQCFKSFKKHATFSKHQARHRGKFKFLCPICRKTFNQKVLMVTHAYNHCSKEISL